MGILIQSKTMFRIAGLAALASVAAAWNSYNDGHGHGGKRSPGYGGYASGHFGNNYGTSSYASGALGHAVVAPSRPDFDFGSRLGKIGAGARFGSFGSNARGRIGGFQKAIGARTAAGFGKHYGPYQYKRPRVDFRIKAPRPDLGVYGPGGKFGLYQAGLKYQARAGALRMKGPALGAKYTRPGFAPKRPEFSYKRPDIHFVDGQGVAKAPSVLYGGAKVQQAYQAPRYSLGGVTAKYAVQGPRPDLRVRAPREHARVAAPSYAIKRESPRDYVRPKKHGVRLHTKPAKHVPHKKW